MGLNHVIWDFQLFQSNVKLLSTGRLYTVLEQLKILIENDERGKTKRFVAYVSQQDGALWRQGGGNCWSRGVALCSQENNTFAQSSGLLMWYGPKGYLLMAKNF